MLARKAKHNATPIQRAEDRSRLRTARRQTQAEHESREEQHVIEENDRARGDYVPLLIALLLITYWPDLSLWLPRFVRG